MRKILSFETRKTLRSKEFIIMAILSVALSCLYLLVIYFMSKGSDIFSTAFVENGVLSLIKNFKTDQIYICVAILVCTLICSDFDSGILKNVISKGYSRTEIFAAKLINFSIVAVVISFVSSIVTFVLSSILFNNIGTFRPIIILQYIILTLGVVAFANLFTMICALLKKSGPSVAVSILVLFLIPMGLSIVKPVFGLDKLPIDVDYLWLGSAIEKLTVENPSITVMIGALVSIIVYIVVTHIVTLASVKKLEV